jgi:hypothetical protein
MAVVAVLAIIAIVFHVAYRRWKKPRNASEDV